MAIELSEKQIKDGWQIVKFGEIAKNISKRVEPLKTDLAVYVGLEHLDPQSLRITRRGVPADVKGQKLRVRPGQIIFGKRRAYQKKVAVADFEGICSAHAMVLEEVVDKIIPGLLPFFMQSDMFMDRAVAISEGSLSPTIKWKTLAIQEFPLPPIERQKEILEVLEKVEECINHCDETLKVTLPKFKKAICNSSIPENIQMLKIGEIGEVITGNTPSPKRKEYWDGSHQFITPIDITEDLDFIKTTVRSVSDKGLEKGRVVPEKSVLITCIGSTVGKAALSSEKCITNQQINSLSLFEGHNPYYILELIRANKSKIIANTSFHAVPIINKGNLSKIRLPIPESTYQHKVGRIFFEVSKTAQTLTKKLMDMQKLRSNVLSSMVGGAQ